MTTTHSLSLGPLSLLATQSGPLLTITIHAPSDTAPVGRMTLTVAEWTSLVALVDCMGAADREMARLRAQERADNQELLTAACEVERLRQQVRELTEENKRLRGRIDNQSRWLGYTPQAAAKKAMQLESDLSAALVSVDAMAKRLEQLQPIVSVLGDWDWEAIAECGWHPTEDGPALTAACRALAHTAREQAKGDSR